MAFNHRNAQRKKPGAIARRRRVSFGTCPAWRTRKPQARKKGTIA